MDGGNRASPRSGVGCSSAGQSSVRRASFPRRRRRADRAVARARRLPRSTSRLRAQRGPRQPPSRCNVLWTPESRKTLHNARGGVSRSELPGGGAARWARGCAFGSGWRGFDRRWRNFVFDRPGGSSWPHRYSHPHPSARARPAAVAAARAPVRARTRLSRLRQDSRGARPTVRAPDAVAGRRPAASGSTPVATHAAAPPAAPAQTASSLASAATPAPRVPPAAAICAAESEPPPTPGRRAVSPARSSCARSSSEREDGNAGASAAAIRGAAR